MGALPIFVVRNELGWTPGLVALWLFTGFLWPQLARWFTARSRDAFHAELHCLLVDSLLAAVWVPLMHFNLLPSAILLAVATADKINTAVRGLWLRSIPVMMLGILAGGLATGFALALPSSLAVTVACLPLVIVHTLAVSVGTCRLVRTVQGRNHELTELSRRDGLTRLANRRYWEEACTRLLAERGAQGLPSTLLMIDMDRLKMVNDELGHAAGDTVLCTLADLVRTHCGPGALAGRLGGDEFAVVLPCSFGAARTTGERLRKAFAEATWIDHPGLHCTISIGLEQAPPRPASLHAWSSAADRALYRAKQGGRNRSAGSQPASG